MTEALAQSASFPSPRTRWPRPHPLGLFLFGLWLAFIAGLFALLVFGYDPPVVEKYLPRVLAGVWTTLIIIGLSMAIGGVLSIPLAFGRLSSNRLLAALAFGYSYFFRGTPLLAQVFLVYYGTGQFASFWRDIDLWWFFRDAFNCAVLTFALNTAAYQAEIFAGAVRAVPKGQWEAASALGLSAFARLRKVIAPQALITALRPYGNELVLMIKGSAIISIITEFDLMGEARYAFSQTYNMHVYLWAAVLYLIMVEAVRLSFERIEKRLTRHLSLR